MSTTACSTNLSTGVGQNIHDTQIMIDTWIRKTTTLLGVYGLSVIATLGICLFIANAMWHLYRDWRVMSKKAEPVGLDDFNVSSHMSSTDDEVYRAEVSRYEDAGPSVGEKIMRGMGALENRYAEYNNQITQYSNKVLKTRADDLVNHSVLDRKADDFQY